MFVDIPTLPLLDQPDPVEEDEEEEEAATPPPQPEKQRKHKSGPKVKDPYAYSDSSGYSLPLVGAVAAFIPLLYGLCKIQDQNIYKQELDVMPCTMISTCR